MRRLLPAVLALATLAAAQDKTRFALEGAVAIPYRDADGTSLHLFRPEGWNPGDQRPAVLFFFGGGWVGGTPEQFAPQARALAARGLVAACAEYRVSNRDHSTPQDAVADAQAAFAYLVAHAAEQGVDPRRIAVAGGSAGGHLAACVGTLTPPAVDLLVGSPAAMILFNPVLDTGPDGFARERVGKDGIAISPLHHVSRTTPPTLLLHGTADRTVPFAQAAAFRAAMAALDRRCELLPYEGRNHGFFNAARSERDFVTSTRAMDRFLATLGWLDGPPTVTEQGTASWHGYTRRDLSVNDHALIVVAPDAAAAGRPWIWRARFFGHEPQADLELLRRGFHLVYCDVADLYANDQSLDAWDAAYDKVTAEFELAPRAALEGMSRGGLMIYRWAARHPERVACIYGDAPVCDIRSWPGGKGTGKGDGGAWATCLRALGLDEATAADWRGNPIDVLAPIAAAHIPLLHVCGEADDVVPVAENTDVLAARYRALGGDIDVIRKPGVGHHPHSLQDPQPIVDFVLRHTLSDGDWSMPRDGLARSRARMLAQKRGTVAFLGGSITHNPGWRELVARDLAERLPAVELRFVNAGIPSFGSTPGAFRLRRDVLAQGPIDLLFVEAAVNDEANGAAPAEMLRGMEGIVRSVRRHSPWTDVVMLHFVDPGKIERIRRGEVPAVITAHEAVAERYGVPSIDLAAEVTWRIARGEFTWEKDFRDLHPAPFGGRLYAASIARLLDRAWCDAAAPAEPHELPSPVDPACYQDGRLVAPGAATAGAGFLLDPAWQPQDGAGTRDGFVGVPVLCATSPGASCALGFDGACCGVMVNAGPDAGVLQWSIDGGEAHRVDLYTPWSGGLHLPYSFVFAAGLPDAHHELHLGVAERPAATRGGNAVRIVHFLIGGAANAQTADAGAWAQRAEAAQQALTQHFWDERAGLYEMAFPTNPEQKPFQYWWQAHALDVLVDGYERTNDRDYLDRATRLWAGVKRKNGGITIDYYDDMLWMGLALLRLQAHTGDADVGRDIDTLWQDIKRGWNDKQGGGIAWRKSQLDYKNTPANAPAVILAVRLFRAHGDAEDLAFAKRIYAWLDAHLVDPTTGFVWDGVNRQGDGKTDKGWAFTYNQGVRIGAAVELYKATHEARYLQDANKTFAATVARLANEQGVLKEGGKDDGGLFKGILVRYLGELVRVDPAAHPQEFEFLQRQAESVWAQLKPEWKPGEALLVPGDWSKPAAQPVELSVQLSGIMLFEQMAKLTGAAKTPR